MNGMTMQRRTGTIAAMLCGLGLAAGAWANNPGDKFKTMDSNADGMVSAEEHAAGVRSMFTQMDANRDGNVTAAEMDAGHKMKMKDDKGMRMSSADKIAKMDTDGDGKLSLAEHEAGAKAKFSEMDTDKNGSLTMQEMQAGHAMHHKDKDRTE